MAIDQYKVIVVDMCRTIVNLVLRGIQQILFPMTTMPVDTILIFRTGQLGDTICALPAMRAVRAAHPDVKMVLLTDRHPGCKYVLSQEILAPAGIFDEILTYIPGALNLRTARELIAKLRPYQFDLLVYLVDSRRATVRNLLRDMLFFKIAGIRRAVGFRKDIVYPFRRAQSTVRQFNQESVRFLRMLRDAGIPCSLEPQFNLPIRENERCVVDSLWKQAAIPVDRFAVAVAPGSKMPAKRWPLERFCDVAITLVREYNAFLIILGGAEDAQAGNKIVQCISPYAVNWAGLTSIMESAAVLQRCHLYLGNDTGTMHLAAAVGIPCVAIFSARDIPGLWYPYGEQHTVLRKDVPCQYCMLVECVKYQMRCLKEIRVDEVVAACSKYLPHVEVN
ncbi:glycosyltransferase family 9 protein [Candidatus Poribacteria bacterium]|nr:glycosyltransferase family 9 protein [Candidatus Poribacteria bacterium]